MRARWAELPTKTNRQNRSIAFDCPCGSARGGGRSFYDAEAFTTAAAFGGFEGVPRGALSRTTCLGLEIVGLPMRLTPHRYRAVQLQYPSTPAHVPHLAQHCLRFLHGEQSIALPATSGTLALPPALANHFKRSRPFRADSNRKSVKGSRRIDVPGAAAPVN